MSRSLRVQRRLRSAGVGKPAPDTMWRSITYRQQKEEYIATNAIEENRYWGTRALTPGMYSSIMEHRWMETPKQGRLEKEKWQFVAGDIVEVIEGTDKGKRGRIIDILHSAMVIKVEGARMLRQDGRDPQSGQTITQFKEDWLQYNEVRLIDPKEDSPCDVEWMDLEDPATGEVQRFRVSKLSGATIPVPDMLSKEETKGDGDGKKDTPLALAQEVSLLEGNMGGEINGMALVKLKVLEEWFIKELEKCHTKDKHLRDELAAEKKEFQYNAYQLALQKLYERVEEEEPWLLGEVAALRVNSRPAPGRMPDFEGDQEMYRELRRAARFTKTHEVRPSGVETLHERYMRTTQRGTQQQLHKEIRLRYEKGSMLRKQRTQGKTTALSKLKDSFKMKPAEYIQDALEIEAALREQLEIGQGLIHREETHVGWKPAPERKRDEMDKWENRFAHMEGVRQQMQELGHNVTYSDADAASYEDPQSDPHKDS
eukprot:TRINITY_DN8311_c0_g1_i1.p1 TRINITY_DN8311_c0_g1~~TRINITY_DN8311_c0_g1_i1.p1  ORF type:complete len:484 (+),score=96.07 TRINITY_DN8311_c0_g1_i1:57-1508(+)